MADVASEVKAGVAEAIRGDESTDPPILRRGDRYVSSYYHICVLIQLYVSSYYCMCPHTTIYVSSYYYICVLLLRILLRRKDSMLLNARGARRKVVH